MRRFVITWAQNATPAHDGFLAALLSFCRENRAKLRVIPGRYKNPTSLWSEQQENHEWWDPRLRRFVCGAFEEKEVKGKAARRLSARRVKLCDNLTVYGDVSIQPTAHHPLTGFETFVGGSSGIFGHPQRAMKCVPTATRTPRLLWTTGACTVPNYTDTRAGKKAEQHHVLGALIVEIDSKGLYWIRNVTWSESAGGFCDISTKWTPNGPRAAEKAASLTLGDVHADLVDRSVLEAARRLAAKTKPKHLVLHDVLDFRSRSHHTKGVSDLYDVHDLRVEDEVRRAHALLREIESWHLGEIDVIRSNHDEHFDRWLNTADISKDLANAPYYHRVWARRFEHREQYGEFPDAFPAEARRLGGLHRTRFLRRNEPLVILDVNHGFHGDKGLGGSKGSPETYKKLGTKTTHGHGHAPYIAFGAMGSGITCIGDHGYNYLPGNWLPAGILLHSDGKRQMMTFIGGRYGAEDTGRTA